MIATARRFLRRPAADRRLLAQALALHVGVAVLLRVVRFGRLTRWLAAAATADRIGDRAVAAGAAERIVLAVRRTSAVLPWGATCLTEALTAATLLRRAGIDTTLEFGVAVDGQRRLDAHAWLEYDGTVIAGASARRYEALVVTGGIA